MGAIFSVRGLVGSKGRVSLFFEHSPSAVIFRGFAPPGDGKSTGDLISPLRRQHKARNKTQIPRLWKARAMGRREGEGEGGGAYNLCLERGPADSSCAAARGLQTDAWLAPAAKTLESLSSFQGLGFRAQY